MSTTMQDLGPFEKLVTVEVAEVDLEAAKGRAARRISRELKIKGFRPGKAPRKIVEATVGVARVRSEAIEELLPEIVGGALVEADLDPAVSPSVEEMRDIDSGVQVDVRVTMWPALKAVPSYEGRTFEVENPELPEEAIQEQVDRLREQFAELETVTRPSVDGDYVSVNLNASRDGQPIAEASASDLLYEVGSKSFIDGLDAKTIGRSAGDIETFETSLPEGFGELAGVSVSMQVLVKEVKEKKLPELTNEWVSDFTEFETVDELRAELVGRMEDMRLNTVRAAFQSKVVADLLEEVELELPEAIINSQMEETFHQFSHQLGESGIEFAQYLELSGMTEEVFVEDLKAQANRSVRTDLLLDAVIAERDLSLDDDEIAELYEALAAQTEEPVDDLRERLSGSVQEKRIVGDILRRKALTAVLESAIPIDEHGSAFDLGFDSLDSASADDDSAYNDSAYNDSADTDLDDAVFQEVPDDDLQLDDTEPAAAEPGDAEGGTDES